MHELGWASSIECWDDDGVLVGGLYGVRIGGFFAGESMFHTVTDASKVALMALVRLARRHRCKAARRAVDHAPPQLARCGRDRPRRVPAPAAGGDCVTHRDDPWMMRTYSGHSTAKASNELYRTNLAKGQTGLSIAFDLPTQTGYDPDSPMARGEVGKVGVPVVPPRPHAHAARRHPAGGDEHVDDHQRHRRRGCWRSTLRTPRSRGFRPASCAARRRTTSSRSTCRAAPTSSRPSRRGA